MKRRSAPPTPVTQPRPAPARVLLVDDQRPLLVMLAEQLMDYGIQVVDMLTDGTKVLPALTRARAGDDRIDVVVMDERMPYMNGLDATRQARAAFPDVQVVLYSAFAGQLGSEPAAAGAAAEVSKGSDPRVLVAAIHHACQLARSHRLQATAT